LGGTFLNSPITALGVIVAVLTAIMSGVLMPRRVVKMLLKSKDEQIRSKDVEIQLWKGIAQQREQINVTALDYARQSVEVNKTAVRALDALATVTDPGDASASTSQVH
jgi:hypothetical protein